VSSGSDDSGTDSDEMLLDDLSDEEALQIAARVCMLQGLWRPSNGNQEVGEASSIECIDNDDGYSDPYDVDGFVDDDNTFTEEEGAQMIPDEVCYLFLQL
jgi:hypothetical protein